MDVVENKLDLNDVMGQYISTTKKETIS